MTFRDAVVRFTAQEDQILATLGDGLGALALQVVRDGVPSVRQRLTEVQVDALFLALARFVGAAYLRQRIEALAGEDSPSGT